MIVEFLIAMGQKTSNKISQEHSMAKTKLELTQAELILMAHVVECAYDEFSNHGCNELDVTKLGLPVSIAAEIGREMVKENVIDEESVPSEDRPYLQDDMIEASSQEAQGNDCSIAGRSGEDDFGSPHQGRARSKDV